jgi:hypothetical protein
MVRFKATDDQVRQIAVNAIKASLPMGMGHLHYNPNQEFPASEIRIHEGPATGERRCSLDYAGGRMVKLTMVQAKDGVWEVRFPHETPDREYQSWVRQYATTEALLQSVPGVEVLKG